MTFKRALRIISTNAYPQPYNTQKNAVPKISILLADNLALARTRVSTNAMLRFVVSWY